MLNLETTKFLKLELERDGLRIYNAIRKYEELGIRHSAVGALKNALKEIDEAVEELTGDLAILESK